MNYLVNLDVPEEIDGRETDPLTGNIIGAAIDVYRALGPSLLESAYEACLFKMNLHFVLQKNWITYLPYNIFLIKSEEIQSLKLFIYVKVFL